MTQAEIGGISPFFVVRNLPSALAFLSRSAWIRDHRWAALVVPVFG
jgi:hypothetical protein